MQLLAPAPTPTLSRLPTGDRAYPRPRPIPPPHSKLENTPDSSVIDPALFEPTNANAVAGPSRLQLPAPAPTPTPSQLLPSGLQTESGGAVAIRSPNIYTARSITQEGATHSGGDLVQTGAQAEPGSGLNEGPATEPLIPLPSAKPQTQSTKKRKLMSTDDLALLEAKELLKGTSRQSQTWTR